MKLHDFDFQHPTFKGSILDYPEVNKHNDIRVREKKATKLALIPDDVILFTENPK